MKLLKKYKSCIGFWLIFSFILQVTSPLVAAMQLQHYRTLAQAQSVQFPELQNHAIADSGVNELIKLIVADAVDAQKTGIAVEVPESLKKCYVLLCDGKEELPASLLWEALPTLLDYAWQLEQTKAPRPSAPPKAPVVGPGVCDFTQVYAGLQEIRDRIGCVGEGCDVSCNSILGILGDACSILGCSIACTLTTISGELVSSSSAILEKIAEIESTLTTCCTALQADLAEVSSAQAACCAEIINDITVTTSLILEALDNIGGVAENCDCDFFITQVANGEPKNHPIADPITQSGVYCLAEDVSGTIVINPGVNNVTILFRGHVFTAGSPGVSMTDSSNIRIDGGTIQNSIGNGISCQNGSNISIENMTFINNDRDILAQGSFPSTYIDNLVINNCQFIQAVSQFLSIARCQNSRVTNCAFQALQSTGDAILILLDSCFQLTCENLSIIDTILGTRLTGIDGTGIYTSSFNNVYITNNTTQIDFYGILLRNSDNNSITHCSISNNSLNYSNNFFAVGSFYGIQIVQDLSNAPSPCDNNSIVSCQINGNSVANAIAPGFADATSLFIGIDVGRVNQGFSPPPASNANNTTIDSCSISNNSNVSFVNSGTQEPAVMMAINVGGVTGTQNGTRTTGLNAAISNCVLNDNLSSTHFVGINLASVVRGTNAPTSRVMSNSCQNSTINNCTINTNIVRGQFNSNPCFAGVAVASIFGGVGTVNSGCGQNCSMSNCSVNGNILDDLAAGTGPEFFVGFMVGSTASLSGGASVLDDAATGCSFVDCSVNNNTYDISGDITALFAGFKLGSIYALGQTATIGARVCANSSLRNCTVNSNRNVVTGTPAFPVCLGYTLGSAEYINPNDVVGAITINTNVCQDCTLDTCTFNGNTNGAGVLTTGISVGSSVSAATVGTLVIDDRVGDNCSLIDCTVNDNAMTVPAEALIQIFAGVALSANSSLINSNFAVTDQACNNFALQRVTVNGNTLTAASSSALTPGFLAGVNIAGASSTIQRSGGGCNNGILDAVSVCKNSMVDTNTGGYLRGIALQGLSQDSTPIANNITATGCIVEDNSITKDGTLGGFYVDGTGANAPGGCDNLMVRDCQVNGNSAALGAGQGYNFINTTIGVDTAVNNVQLNGCLSRGNRGVPCPGYNFEKTPNALVEDCLSIMNTGTGFVLKDVVDSFFQGIEATGNQGNGIECVGDTKNVGIINSQVLANTIDGLSFATTTTLCFVNNNTAQSNTGFGFNNQENDEWKHLFLNNYAIANVVADYSTGIPLVIGPVSAQNSFANITV